VLGVDIGGTNTNLCIAGVEHSKPILLVSLNFESQKLDSLVPAVQETLAYADKQYDIHVSSACIGAAGVVSPYRDSARLTNVRWNVDTKDLIEETQLSSVFVINDFQTIGYGINLLDPKNKADLFEVRISDSDSESAMEPKAVVGAGTGLGKCTLVYDKYHEIYVPIPSEGGHGDFPAHNDFEMQLLSYVKNLRDIPQSVTYEELLSGRGIENIYLFLRNDQRFGATRYTGEIDVASDKAPLIAKYKEMDETCRETFRLFTQFYARCAKNFVLDTMAAGGLYIAGGIAAKNKEAFATQEFLREFEHAYRRADVLKNIPIYVIVNYDVSLSGACFAAIYHFQKNTI